MNSETKGMIEILDEIDKEYSKLRYKFISLRQIGKTIPTVKKSEERNGLIAIYSRMLGEIVNSLRALGIKLNGFITEIDKN